MIKRIRQLLGIDMSDILESLKRQNEGLEWMIRINRGELNHPETYKEYIQWLERVDRKPKQ